MGRSIFPGIGLWGKTALGLGAVVLCIISFAAGTNYWLARNYAEKKALEIERNKFGLLAYSIDEVLADDRSNLLTLRDSPPVQGMLRALDGGGDAAVESWRTQLEATFSAFANNHPQYLQLIYADELGNELARVQRTGSSIRTIPKNELLRNEPSPSATEALKQPPGRIVTSDVHLLREHGKLVEPHMPVLQFFTPVYSIGSRVRGTIAITSSTDFIFREVKTGEDAIRRGISNEQGYFIKHADPSKAFGFDLGFDYRIRDEEPNFDASAMQNQDTLTRYDPSDKEMDGYQKIFFDPADHSRYWLLSVNIPEALVFAEVDAATHAMLLTGAIIGLLSASLILWLVSRKIVTPVVKLAQAAALMQRGDMSIRVDETSVRDEFHTLYATINDFAASQQQYAERLQHEISQAKNDLAETEAWNRLILDSVGEGIYGLDLDGNLTFINPAACRMLGYEIGELLDRPLHTLILPKGADGTAYPRERCPMFATVNDGRTHRVIDEIFRRKDGSSFPVSYTSTCIRKEGALLGAVIAFSDTTERQQIEEELRLASLVLQNSSEGVLITDADNNIVAANPAFSSITGYSLEEVKGKNPKIFSSGRHDQAFYQAMWNSINITGQWQGEIWDRQKSGEIHANRMAINTIRNIDGSVHRYVLLFSDITEKKLSEELIWKQANFDTLTGLPNRRMFRDRLLQGVKKSDRTSLPLALLLIDLDQFKEVNYTLGHDVGDILLQEAARRFLACMRESDTVARLGGDEFAVILGDLTDTGHVDDVAQKIIDRLAQPFYLGSEVIYASASIGITLYPNDASDLDALMKNADQAMYVAKNRGRNRYSYFTQSLQEAAQTRLRLTNDLRGALAGGQFRVYYQPVVDLSTERIHKAEALLRWEHPERGMVNPMEFIPLAEDSGLINEIGDWVFRESARWAKHWSQKFCADFQVSVNMSPVQFRAEGKGFADKWLHHLQELQLPGKNMVIEITEGLLLNAESGIVDKLLVFRDAGIQVAIDDFGTGYSSLSYLKKFDIDYLKIDQSFVRNLATDPNDMALSEAIIVMAHKLGLKVIAEGVELEGQSDMLADAGCDFAQGYLFSRPVPPEQFEKLLQRDFKTL